ncbi:uncharacterized protein LOC126714661 [Quercus robur]|uniref:uncharacterized protein LOC126714661 n=1 Tax=Quercus robur TaxID=38942 RepID=UPI0021628647|nr:uncharacterized protein LOC126714661 [Quercus robur]
MGKEKSMGINTVRLHICHHQIVGTGSVFLDYLLLNNLKTETSCQVPNQVQRVLLLPFLKVVGLILVKRRIINEDKCHICTREAETAIHVLWDCAAVTDVWAGSIPKLQKGASVF